MIFTGTVIAPGIAYGPTMIDLLVIGAVGHCNAAKHVDADWGGTAQNLARLATCTVLVVK